MTEERAVLAGGCYWGAQELFRRYEGVLCTPVGYTGGNTANATYRNHGAHAEAVEIIFERHWDPLSIGDLLHNRRAASDCRGHHRRCRRIRAVERQGRDGGRAGGYTCHFVRPNWRLPVRKTRTAVN